MTIWELIALAKSSSRGASSVFRFKGSVLTENDLPATGEDGDLYLVDSEDSYFAWDGEGWTDVGNIFTIEDEEDLEKARTALQPEDLEPYRTAADQDAIDATKVDKVDGKDLSTNDYSDDEMGKVSNVLQATTSTIVGPAAIATFDASAADMPLQKLLVDIEPVQAGSGDPSPENVRPITGWTGLQGGVCGKNLLRWREDIGLPKTQGGITYEDAGNGRIKVSGTATGLNFLNLTVASKHALYPLKPGETYFLSAGSDNNSVRMELFVDGASVEYAASFSYTMPTTFTSWYVRLRCTNTAEFLTPIIAQPFICLNSEPRKTFEPYNGELFSVTWETEAGTVYGGTLDVVTGELTKTWESVDMGTIDLNYVDTSGVFYWNQTGKLIGLRNILSQRYRVADTSGVIANINDFEIRGQSNSGQIGFKDSSLPQEPGKKQELNGVLLLYELKYPTTYQLTPQEVTTLLGTNNIWADCGDVTVTYGAYLETLKAFAHRLGDSILSAIAPLEDTYTASRAYAVGAFLFVGTKFYKVSAAIGSGDTINPGTNVTQTTVAEQLMALANV